MHSDLPDFTEQHGREFRGTLLIVVAAHVLLFAGIWGGAAFWKKKPAEQITWLDGGGNVGAPAAPEAASQEPAQPEAAPEPPKTPPEEIAPPATIPAVKPAPTPRPTPKPTPKPASAPTPKPKSTPKPTAKPATPKPAAAKPANSREGATGGGDTGSTAKTGAGTANNPGTKGGSGAQGGTLTESQLAAYFAQVGSRFKEVWNQPLTISGTGQDITAIVRIRVGADGTVMSATLERGTGNSDVDASILSAIPRFKKVPPPPPALLKGGVMDEKMEVIYDI